MMIRSPESNQNEAPHFIWTSIFFAPALAIYIDFISKDEAGIALSFLIFLAALAISCKNLGYGIVIAWALAILVPETPRDILDVYEKLQIDKSVKYNVISSITAGPASLVFHLFIFNTLLCLLRVRESRIETWKLATILTILTLGSTGLYIEAATGGRLAAPGPIVTDFKFPLILMMGLIQGAYLHNKNQEHLINQTILLLPLILGARVICFIGSDIFSGTPKLDVMTHPLLSTCVLSYCITHRPKAIYNKLPARLLLYLSLVNASRGLIALQCIIIIVTIALAAYKNGLGTIKKSSELLFIGAAILASVAATSPRLFDFLLWKLSDVNTITGDAELSGSGQVRTYELKNILAGMDNIGSALVGKGFGGSFDFSRAPLPPDIDLDLKSYSEQQLKLGVFYAPHSFFSSTVLKYGLFGIFIYFFIPAFVFLKNREPSLLGLVALVSIYNYYWRIEYMLLIGMAFSISRLVTSSREKRLT